MFILIGLGPFGGRESLSRRTSNPPVHLHLPPGMSQPPSGPGVDPDTLAGLTQTGGKNVTEQNAERAKDLSGLLSEVADFLKENDDIVRNEEGVVFNDWPEREGGTDFLSSLCTTQQIWGERGLLSDQDQAVLEEVLNIWENYLRPLINEHLAGRCVAFQPIDGRPCSLKAPDDSIFCGKHRKGTVAISKYPVLGATQLVKEYKTTSGYFCCAAPIGSAATSQCLGCRRRAHEACVAEQFPEITEEVDGQQTVPFKPVLCTACKFSFPSLNSWVGASGNTEGVDYLSVKCHGTMIWKELVAPKGAKTYSQADSQKNSDELRVARDRLDALRKSRSASGKPAAGQSQSAKSISLNKGLGASQEGASNGASKDKSTEANQAAAAPPLAVKNTRTPSVPNSPRSPNGTGTPSKPKTSVEPFHTPKAVSIGEKPKFSPILGPVRWGFNQTALFR